MTIENLKEQNLILFEVISGSKAYGLNTPESDTDIKGVFILPKDRFYSRQYIPQISDATNDQNYYELGRFIELLAVNNPSMLELLASTEECILHKHPIMDELRLDFFLSKLCRNTFGKYAISQIKKAKGLNKKIQNPMELNRKSILEFCFVNHEQGSISLPRFLKNNSWNQSDCGLVKIPNMKSTFGLYHCTDHTYNGIVKKLNDTNLTFSSVKENIKPECLLFFNQDGYSSYCKEFKQYWEWKSNRNEERYSNDTTNQMNYDTKKMMHTFRLLYQGIEIARHERITTKTSQRSFLLDIKKGNYEYEYLMDLSSELFKKLEESYCHCNLQDSPDIKKINFLNYRLREDLYNQI